MWILKSGFCGCSLRTSVLIVFYSSAVSLILFTKKSFFCLLTFKVELIILNFHKRIQTFWLQTCYMITYFLYLGTSSNLEYYGESLPSVILKIERDEYSKTFSQNAIIWFQLHFTFTGFPLYMIILKLIWDVLTISVSCVPIMKTPEVSIMINISSFIGILTDKYFLRTCYRKNYFRWKRLYS